MHPMMAHDTWTAICQVTNSSPGIHAHQNCPREAALARDPYRLPDIIGSMHERLGSDSRESTDLTMMRRALLAAKAAAERGEVPVGAVVARGGEVLAVAANERETAGDPTAHAELLALRRAAATLGGWRLTGCTLYATLEPCPMCAGAAHAARISRLVYAAPDPKAGYAGTLKKFPPELGLIKTIN